MNERRISIEVFPTDTIKKLEGVMINAYQSGCVVCATFKGVNLTCGGGDAPGDIVKKYRHATKKVAKKKGSK